MNKVSIFTKMQALKVNKRAGVIKSIDIKKAA
jgi:hypothetical protein